MGETRQVLVPDIGDFKDVPIIEIQVKPGDRIAVEAPLITLESDKASMEVPSPSAGVVQALAAQLGDRVSEGVPILTLEPYLDKYYFENVIGGPGSFMIPAETYEKFADAVLRKLVLEIALNTR